MAHFDSDYVEHLMQRLESIPEDATPRWGKLRKNSLIEHLIWTVRHSMGKSTKVSFMGNWFTVNILAPLYLRGFVPTPKNLKFKGSETALREPGDIETLHAHLEEYLNLVQADELQPGIHPLFGDIGIDGWDRLHLIHFEHHCKQFGV